MPEPYWTSDCGTVTLYCGDCLEILPTLADSSIDSLVTDPPYGLSFMGKKWDYDVPSVVAWQECLRVLKPGGHLLAFAGTRTQHRMAVNIEDAGFEIRDMLAWMYGSGYPKSLNVSTAIDRALGMESDFVAVGNPVKRMIPCADQNATGSWIKDNGREYQPGITQPATEQAKKWQGFGTALKPAMEPVTLARKPLIGTVAENVLAYGTGGLNIDGCRVELDGDYKCKANGRPSQTGLGDNYNPERANQPDTLGRWPANIIHDGSDEVLAVFPDAPVALRAVGPEFGEKKSVNAYGDYGPRKSFHPREETNKSAARFFYCAKASRSERGDDNSHPTVKPIDLMAYLCRMVTPPDGVILDPFAGSGSTGLAAVQEGFRFIGIEISPDYCAIAKRRIEAALGKGTLFDPAVMRQRELLEA